MDKLQIPSYNLLAKHFSQKCTIKEEEYIASWRTQHESQYADFLQHWREAHEDLSSFIIPDKRAVWHKIQQQIHITSLYTRNFMLRVASLSVMIALVIGFFLSSLLQEDFPVQQLVVCAPSGHKSQVLLPDGTHVWLNAESRLTYASNFNTENRTVTLEGEAYFDVTKSIKHPFMVRTGVIDVKVMGTSFNVRSHTDEPTISVALVRGKVQLFSAIEGQLLTSLQPNQKTQVLKSTLLCKVAPYTF